MNLVVYYLKDGISQIFVDFHFVDKRLSPELFAIIAAFKFEDYKGGISICDELSFWVSSPRPELGSCPSSLSLPPALQRQKGPLRDVRR